MKKVILGLSGGVDSAVAARLLQAQGWAVEGLYLNTGGPAEQAAAQASADFLGIPLHTVDVSAQLEARVCAPFAAAYLRGQTPNPCILCNPAVKFAALLDRAQALGAEAIATGHYARAEAGALYRGRPANDQSYMLCRLTRAQLDRLLLPLGGLEKAEVRALARDWGLPPADKPDSMEICFIPQGDYPAWLAGRGAVPGPGRFLWKGVPVGQHQGFHRWTVGQRIPGLYEGEKLYVTAIDAAGGDILVDTDAALYRREFSAGDPVWLTEPPQGPFRASVKVRHSRKNEPDCTVCPRPDGSLRIVCDTPLRAPAPGQAAALYQGERLLGGGIILGSDSF